MPKVTMIATKNFLNRGVMVKIGEEIKVDDDLVFDYQTNELAKLPEGAAPANPAAPADTEFGTDLGATQNLQGLKVGELRTMADTKNIANTSTMTKPELIAAIQATR